jgi:hypothetical protein
MEGGFPAPPYSAADFKLMERSGFMVRPNADVSVGTSDVLGETCCKARHRLPKGTRIPFCGEIRRSGRENYQLSLPASVAFKKAFGKGQVVCPDLMCAASYVNCADGPYKNPNAADLRNVKYVTNGIQIYWETLRVVYQGEEIWGGYGQSYWDSWEKPSEVPITLVNVLQQIVQLEADMFA